jgi:hypothetical protein
MNNNKITAMSQCRALKEKEKAQKRDTVGCTVSLGSRIKPTHSTMTKQEFPQKGSETEKVSEDF